MLVLWTFRYQTTIRRIDHAYVIETDWMTQCQGDHTIRTDTIGKALRIPIFEQLFATLFEQSE
jgi:hypothetical protein